MGDSTANATGNGLVKWAVANPTMARVKVFAGPGCGLSSGGWLVLGQSEHNVDQHCSRYLTDVPRTAAAQKPDVVMLITTTWDVENRRLIKGGPVLATTDPALKSWIADSFTKLTDAILATGVSRVVWIREPPPVARLLGPGDPQGDAQRHRVLYDIMDGIAATHPNVRVVDLAGWVTAHGLAGDTAARPDASHWTPAMSLRIADDYLGPALVRAALT
jgi:hypothetical protein